MAREDAGRRRRRVGTHQRHVEAFRLETAPDARSGRARPEPERGAHPRVALGLGRCCYGLELNPFDVDSAVRRWQAYTGNDARHASSGRIFNQMEAERAEEVHNAG